MIKRLPAPDFESRRSECLDLLDDALQNVRELSQLLRPVILDDFGLDAALRWLVERFSERTGIQAGYRSNFSGRLSEQLETQLFRITQEALTNISRHSDAKTASISLGVEKDHVHLTIEDDGREAVELAEKLQPDIVVMDVSMPELNGIEGTRRIGNVCPRTRVLALSMHRDSMYVREILRAGAQGYLVKDADDDALLDAVRARARGEGYLSPAVSSTVLNDYRKHVTDPIDLLTTREREVLQMIAEGHQ